MSRPCQGLASKGHNAFSTQARTSRRAHSSVVKEGLVDCVALLGKVTYIAGEARVPQTLCLVTGECAEHTILIQRFLKSDSRSSKLQEEINVTDASPNTAQAQAGKLTGQFAPQGVVAKLLYLFLQPLVLITVALVWLSEPESPLIYPAVLVCVQLFLGILEYFLPRRVDWRQSAGEKLSIIAVAFVGVSSGVAVAVIYGMTISGPVGELREFLHLDIWPTSWPLILQVLLAFFLSEFMWYWLHRAEHRWDLVWRLSGHGAHHSFKHLEAINSGANHPLELFFLVLPSVFLEVFFGAGLAAAGATILLVTQAALAHTNIHMNTKVIGWLFTTNTYHIHHHSVVLEQSNTNFGCAAIIWDRIFGTFADAATEETGTGPTEPTMWQKFIMPVKQPGDTQTAPR